MFSGLRANSVIYLLDKSDRPRLRIGQVVSISNPMPKLGQMPYTNDTYVDIVAKVGEESINLNQLPSQLTIANFGTAMVVSESREAMLAEVEGMKRASQSILDSVEQHQAVVEECDRMMADLNPTIAKERANDERIGAMEQRMGGIEGALTSIQSMLEDALSRPAPTKTK